MDNPNNRMIAAGRLESRPELSHEVMNEPFYAGTLLVKRLSARWIACRSRCRASC